MDLPEPFLYAREVHLRKHSPGGYVDYASYKPWLRDEFVFRCLYCLEREVWYPSRHNAFSVDHVISKSEDETLECVYNNLLYACVRCNTLKGTARLIDPTSTAFADHLRVEADGQIRAMSKEGERVIEQLLLDQDPALANRRSKLRLIRLKIQFPADAIVDELFLAAFGFPEDLPELKQLRPVSGRIPEESEIYCYFDLKQRGELPSTYLSLSQ
jgi:hypothetical protein